MQLVEGEVDGESGNSEIGGQGASGGKTRRVITKVPGDQFVANLAIELLMEGFGRFSDQANQFESDDGTAPSIFVSRIITWMRSHDSCVRPSDQPSPDAATPSRP
jgi:hypothetical protein